MTRTFKKMNHSQPHGAFGRAYEVLCHERCLRPLLAVCAHIQERRLRFCTDNVSLQDWSPILNSIAQDRSLSEIYVYSRQRCKKVKEKINTEEKVCKFRRGKYRGPILYTNYMLRCLVDAIAVCMRDSAAMTRVTLDGIPLSSKYLKILCDGVANCRSLKKLSLTRCQIGDAGCDLVLDALQKTASLYSLNLSSCCLTSTSATLLSIFLKKKRTTLLQSVWKETSDRICDQRSIQGLRTLILNNNRKLGSTGIKVITEVLKEDFWVKTLNVRHCGLTRNDGMALIELLETNSVLTTMDLKENDIPLDILRSIHRLLKRRQEKGERIPLNKRLLDRRDCFVGSSKERNDLKESRMELTNNKQCLIANHRDFKKRCFARTPRQHRKNRKNHGKADILRKSLNRSYGGKRNKSKKKIKQLDQNKRYVTSGSCLRHDKSDLRDLTARLSKITGCNESLLLELRNGESLLAKEETSTMKAKRDYLKLELKMEKLTKKIRMQKKMNSSVSQESCLLKNLQSIFLTLEKSSVVTEKNVEDLPQSQRNYRRKSDTEGFSRGIIRKDDLKCKLICNVISGSVMKNRYRRSIAKGPLRMRPHCPHSVRM